MNLLHIIFQLDKALLCHQCERFRCICERNEDTTSRNSTDQLNCNSIPPAAEANQDSNNVLLRRSTSRSNTSLNFGTNIFKRFAERMSANNNFLATTLRSSSTNYDMHNNEPR